MSDGFDLSRRRLLQLAPLTLAGLSGDARAQQENPTNPTQQYGFTEGAELYGPQSERPSPGSSFFDNRDRYTLLYEDENGQRSIIRDGDNAWQPLNYSQQVNVFSSDDLPAPTNGTHTLEDNTAYVFNGFVTSPYGLELGVSTPLIGRHGGIDGFIHTGTNTAITGTDAGFFARDLYVHAPGGTLFDLSADINTEMLVESCAFSDAAGIGQIASLGTIDGYRVPSFKGCNFEEFAAGLTFDGTSRKIFFEGCPFRTISTPGVTMFTLSSTLDTEIFKLSTDCYVKDVEADTVVIDVESGGEPTEYLKLINCDFIDADLQRPNILTGALDENDVGTIITDSYPLSNSRVTGDLDLDSPTTVTGSGASPTQIAGSTTLNNAERVTSPSPGVIEYVGKPKQLETIHANASVSGANTEFALYIRKNGSVIDRTRSLGFLANSSNATGVVSLTELTLQTGDTVSAAIENVGGTKDLDVETLSLTV